MMLSTKTWLALVLITLVVLYSIISYLFKKRAVKKYVLNKHIKENFKKISVPITDIQILDRSYFSDTERDAYSISDVADALYEPQRNKSVSEKWVTAIVYEKYFYQGKMYRLNSTAIEMTKEIVYEKIKRSGGNLDIYIDPNNPEYHYFDLSFLD